MLATATHLAQSIRTTPLPAFDEDGFLIHAEDWNHALARELAAEQGVTALGPKHWEVIDLVRREFFLFGQLPVMRLICRKAGIVPGSAHQIFPSCRSLWRIAGLPNPGEEAKAYM
jgi:tRNA 2-thiouridine synthesizing protein E